MSEVFKYYLQLVEKIRDLVNNKFSDQMEKKPVLDGFTPEKQKEYLKKHSDGIRAEVLKSLSTIGPEIQKMKSGTIADRRMALFPGLSSAEDSKKQIALTEQNNAMLVFNTNYPQGNLDSLISSLQNAIESKQYVFASTLFDQIKNSKSLNDLQDSIKNEFGMLEAEYFKTLKIDEYDKKLSILDYADRLDQASKILIERSEVTGDDRYYLPEYGSNEWQDKMILGDIEIKTGVEFDLESNDSKAPVPAAAAE